MAPPAPVPACWLYAQHLRSRTLSEMYEGTQGPGMHVGCLVNASSVSSTGTWLDMSGTALPHKRSQALLLRCELCGRALKVGSKVGIWPRQRSFAMLP